MKDQIITSRAKKLMVCFYALILVATVPVGMGWFNEEAENNSPSLENQREISVNSLLADNAPVVQFQ